MRKTALALTALLLSAASALPAVIRIPGDYATIQAAVDAAVDGDTLIIDPKGSYTEDVVIDNKALSLVAEYSFPLNFLTGRILVQNLAAGKTFVLTGIRSQGATYQKGEGLYLMNNPGSVRVEDCTLEGRDVLIALGSDSDGSIGVKITNCPDAAFARCVITGGDGGDQFFGYPAGDGAAGLSSAGSTVTLYDCDLEGGRGGGADWGDDPGDGDHGCLCVSTSLFASGCHFAGGDAGSEPGGKDGRGGNGLQVSGTARLLDNTFEGGSGSPPGLPVGGNVIHYLDGTARHFHMPTPGGEENAVALTFEGMPGDLAALLFAHQPGSQFVPDFNGQLLLATTALPILVYLGAAPSGTLYWEGFIPKQNPGFIASTAFIQSIFMDVTSDATLGPPRTLTLLGEAYDYDPVTINVPKDVPTIQQAVEGSKAGDTILVAPGTYKENIDYKGMAVTVKSSGGPTVTVIDGGGLKSVASFTTGEGRDSVLEGFTLTNGSTNGGSTKIAGGVYCRESSPSIRNNVINNNIGYKGGGVHLESSSAEVCGNIITGNFAETSGGGISCKDDYGAPILSNNVILDNVADDYGGGIYGEKSRPMIIGNLIGGNKTNVKKGGGLFFKQCEAEIAHCSIADNAAADHGGGLSCFATTIDLRDTILWNNAAAGQGDEIHIYTYSPPDPSLVTMSYCDVGGGAASVYVEPGNTLVWGAGVIDADPLFITGPNGDYYLSQDPPQPGVNNPCVDSGSGSAAVLGLDKLWTRTDEVPDAGTVDMGFHYGPK